jgi:hypothetical protein
MTKSECLHHWTDMTTLFTIPIFSERVRNTSKIYCGSSSRENVFLEHMIESKMEIAGR